MTAWCILNNMMLYSECEGIDVYAPIGQDVFSLYW